MRIGAQGLVQIGLALVVVMLVVVITAVPMSRPAYAASTPDKCDLDGKYWCFSESYDPYTGGVYLQIRSMWGSRDGGYNWWQRYITQDWHRDSYNIFYFQGGWAPGTMHTTTGFDDISYTRAVADEALVRNQFRGEINVPPYTWKCDRYVDWHIYSAPGQYVLLGPTPPTCLTPQY